MNVFSVVKDNVTAKQVAIQYGMKINRNGLACCPFHSDKTASMKIDKRYYCFGCGETGDAIDLVAKASLSQKKTIGEYLPGPYTFILKKRKIVPRSVTGGLSNVGVRVPDNEIACGLAGIFPITTTSANISDDEMLSRPSEILEQLDCEVDLVIDVGELKSEKASSIIDLTGLKPKIIRD